MKKMGPLFQVKLDETADYLIQEFVCQNAIRSKSLAKVLQREGIRSGEAAWQGRWRAVPAGGRGLSRLAMARSVRLKAVTELTVRRSARQAA